MNNKTKNKTAEMLELLRGKVSIKVLNTVRESTKTTRNVWDGSRNCNELWKYIL